MSRAGRAHYDATTLPNDATTFPTVMAGPCPGHPRTTAKAQMAGTGPAMTEGVYGRHRTPRDRLPRDTAYPCGSDRSTSRANTAEPYGIAASLKL